MNSNERLRRIQLMPIAIDSSAGATRSRVTSFADLPKLLAAAPHRMMFFAGASAVLVSMLWWTCYLVNSYFGLMHLPAPPVPAGWAHAVLTQYGMLPMFMFGFLLTVFPRWMNQPALTQRHYVPVFVCLFSGYLLTHGGLLGLRGVMIGGLCLMLLGWCIGLLVLGSVLMRNVCTDRHALSCFTALLLGALGLAAFIAFVFGAPWQFAFLAIKFGTFGLLLPVYFTVCHRMIPFFSSIVAPNYRVVRPAWSLPALWLLLMGHLILELQHRYNLLWLADAPLAIFFAWHWLAWQPWKAVRSGLLAVLHVAAMWLPVAFVLFAAQSLVLQFSGEFPLGRAPVHALAIGFFGSMLVAMVTRVTQGHSGRPLEMGVIPWICFALLQVVAIVRVLAEIADHQMLWLIIAAGGWVLAFLPWVLRSARIYWSPRADGRAG
jgi:uncharacterized protein involved in response to NO